MIFILEVDPSSILNQLKTNLASRGRIIDKVPHHNMQRRIPVLIYFIEILTPLKVRNFPKHLEDPLSDLKVLMRQSNMEGSSILHR